ncbi:MAG: dual specificity protein phosphatase family protein [Gemmataceae bacterium]|nr:dual specificity protein phosphatase family protein [Gemmata sp.]MDW8199080.1 dual specificity protein phosphatase family protein [Gemmataceae bacterium]
MHTAIRWLLGGLVGGVVFGPPLVLYRAQYIHTKRFREVEPGRFYRSGQMTEAGLREVIQRFGIKTIVNLQHEEPDPLLVDRWLGQPTLRESELCRQLGVKYLLLTPDILPPDNTVDREPPVVGPWLQILDDETNYPLLVHCKAGLHRTGRLTAIYRMEYHGWSVAEAVRELRDNGYGFVAASDRDDFIIQFIQNYKPRRRFSPGTHHTGGSPP